MNPFKTFGIAVGIFVISFILIQMYAQKPSGSFGSYAPTGGGTYRLQSSVGTSNTTITLTSFKEPVSNIKYTMSYLNTDVIYGTLDPQTSKPEFISATGVTQNADGTATLTGVTRGLSRTPAGSNCIASTTLAQSHAAQSIFIISDSPCFFQEYVPLRTAATSSALLKFSSTTPPRLDSPAAQGTGTYIATTSEFATVAYVDAIAIAGVSNGTESVKGVWEGATQIESASSSILGSTGAGLVLQARYATSSPGSAGLWTVITNNAGKIAQGFLDLTQSYTWTGLHTYSNGLTSNGTTTVLASSLTTNPLTINSLAYKWPSVRGASSTMLSENGSGTLSWQLPPGGQYTYATTTTITVTNTNATSTSFTIPAGFLTASSTIRVNGGIECQGDGTGGGNCDIALKSGNVTLAGGTFATAPASQNAAGNMQMTVVFNNSLTSQTGAFYPYVYAAAYQNFTGNSAATSADMSGSVTLSIAIGSSGTHATTKLSYFTIVITR